MICHAASMDTPCEHGALRDHVIQDVSIGTCGGCGSYGPLGKTHIRVTEVKRRVLYLECGEYV